MVTLVTGGAGFIGSHVCERLLKDGEDIICIDDLCPFYDPQYKLDNIDTFANKDNFTFYNADIRDFSALKEIFGKHDIKKVVHLAARVGIRDSLKNPKVYEEVNIHGTLNLLLLASRHKADNFIFGSSSSVYGRKGIPFHEKDMLGEPSHPYGASKMAAEMLCYAFNKKHGLPVTCLRFFSVYGPRGRPDMAPYAFTQSILGDRALTLFGNGESKRDYTHVLDIVQGIVLSLDKQFPHEIINLGNGKEISLTQLISKLEHLCARKAKINHLDPLSQEVMQTRADISKAKKLLGWRPSISFDKGISDFVSWFAAQRARS